MIKNQNSNSPLKNSKNPYLNMSMKKSDSNSNLNLGMNLIKSDSNLTRNSQMDQNNSSSLYNSNNLTESQNDLEMPLNEILFWKIKEFIKDKFETSLHAKTSLQEVLDITSNLADDIVIVKERMVQCFPPKYNIFERYFFEYQENIYKTLYPYVKDENEQYLEENKADLILLAKWLDRYEHILRKVGVDVNQCEIGGVGFFLLAFKNT